MLLAVAYMIGVAPVQVGEFLHACAQPPRLLGAVWLIAAAILRTLPAADGRSQDRRPFLIVQQRVDVIHEGDVLPQLVHHGVQRGLDGSAPCSGEAGDDGFRFLLSCLSLARHVDGLASRRTAGRR